MTTPRQQDAPTMFYPLNPCGHLRGPGGGCIGSPECPREPVSADKLGELVQRAGELRARLLAHPAQAVTGEGRATVADKLGAAVNLGECLSQAGGEERAISRAHPHPHRHHSAGLRLPAMSVPSRPSQHRSC
jgi:hypothetical protein